ncbi:hypothetical protein B0H10DRAFT_2225803 [Mycena sp. CBHHK59/15]|nr:hypothetical protein B0H10DRAFT_2225803 [Mycena sp. CBHHK59/15]
MRHAVVLDDDNDVMGMAKTHLDPLKLWLDEYKLYLHLHEVVLEGMDTNQWWGVHHQSTTPLKDFAYNYTLQINAHCYPVWASLAWDYLAIMLSSVSTLVDDDLDDDYDEDSEAGGEADDESDGWDGILTDDPDNYDPDYDMDY